jgi:acyl transferase domain-containing protein/acyl carrier protein
MSDSAFLRSLAGLSREKRELLLRMLQRGPEPVAIVGMACRLPGGADDPDAFWRNLVEGRDAVGRIPADRWPADDYYDPDPAAPGRMNSPYGAFLDRVDLFDPAFFGISPREAARVDPQQRLFLEVAWEALENAGQTMSGLAGSRTGVFAAVYQSDYSWLLLDDEDAIDAYMASGLSHAIVANRLSYFLDLRGPSIAVDTACSSSLVAFHMACESVRNGESDMAVAGGVNVMISPTSALPIAKWGMMSPDGRCKTFDARANGFVRGEGCGVLVVKRLADARRDGDRVLALCRGSAVNQDGRTNVLTAPNGLAQREVIERALRAAGLEGAEIGYVEAHGTGTALGDPIEMEALIDVLGRDRPANRPCHVGSVKTNIGHLEAAAGAAGLIKAVQVLRHRTIPPNLHFRELNPHISLDGVPFRLPLEAVPWESPGSEPRRAGVSSFGFGGTNAHVVLEEFVPAAAGVEDDDGRVRLFVASTPNAAALPAHASTCRARLDGWRTEGIGLADVCHSAAVRRTHFDHRLAIACRSMDELAAALDDLAAGRAHALAVTGRRPRAHDDRVVFVYSGQGTQWVGAGRTLLETSAAFRGELERWDELFRGRAGWSILAEIAAAEDVSRLRETEIAQPVIFALQMALTAAWRAWGIRPSAVVGHSVGEVAAACVAGAISPEQAADILVVRGRLLQRLTGRGRMAMAWLTPEAAAPDLKGRDRVIVAARNTPDSVVVSGDTAEVEALLEEWGRRGIRTRRLPVDYAFHSPQVEPLVAELVGALAGLEPRPAGIPMVSTVTADRVAGTDLDADYWGRNLIRPVLFAPAIRRLAETGHRIFLEVSPHPALLRDVQACATAADAAVTVAGSLRRGQPDDVAMAIGLGRLYAAGCSPDWQAVNGPGGRFVPPAAYPWQRKRYWIDTRSGRRHNGGPGHPLLARQSRGEDGEVFETDVSAASPRYQGDHRIHGVLVVPAMSYLEMVTAAAGRVLGPGRHRLRDVVVRDALLIPEEGAVTLRLSISEVQAGQGASFGIEAAPAGSRDEWRLYAQGRILAGTSGEGVPPSLDRDAVRDRCTGETDGETYYELGRSVGGQLGPRFNGIRHLWHRPGEVLGRLDLTHLDPSELRGYILYPAFADALLHIAYAGLEGDPVEGGVLMPIGFDDVCYHRAPEGETWCHYVVRTDTAEAVVGDVRLHDAAGELLAEVTGVRYRRAASQAVLRRREQQEFQRWVHAVEWRLAAGRPDEVVQEPASGGWLILADEGGCGDALAEALRGRGDPVVVARPGAGPDAGADAGRTGDGSARVDPLSVDELAALLGSAVAEHPGPAWRVVHLWALNGPSFPALRSALALVQAAVRLEAATPPRVWVVTRGAQPAGEVDLDLAGAALWGFGRTVALEQARHWGALIDLDPAEPAEAAAALVAELLRDGSEDEVALRSGDRLVPRLVRHAVPVVLEGGPRFDRDAAYLITGGLGAIGRRVALWLAERGAGRILLVGRSGDGPGDAPFLDRLRELGAEPMVRAADVARRDELAAVLDELDAPLGGVFHAAGVVADGAVATFPPDRFEEALAAKVDGARHLHELTRDRPPEWFILFSSAAAILGSPGQSNYAAANACMDALAHHRRAIGLPALSVNWGPWDVGMARVVGEKGARRWDAFGISVMGAAQGLEILPWLQAGDRPQLAVLPVRWPPADPDVARRLGRRSLLAELAGSAATTPATVTASAVPAEMDLPGRVARAHPRRRRQLLDAYLRDRIRMVLGAGADDEIDSDAGLFDLGMDSLTAVELKEALELEIGQPLPTTLVFDHPTIAHLVEYLHDRLGAGGWDPDERAGGSAMAAAASDDAAGADDDLASLTEEELVARLASELEHLPGADTK